MFTIISYLKQPLSENKFFNIEDEKKLQTLKNKMDEQYVEGAIVATFNGETFLSLEQVDLIDQLWAYFLNSFEELNEKGIAEFYFPDQPLRCELKNVNKNEIQVTIDTKTYLFPRKLFLNEMIKGAQYFFQTIEENLDWKGYYEFNIQQIKKLKEGLK